MGVLEHVDQYLRDDQWRRCRCSCHAHQHRDRGAHGHVRNCGSRPQFLDWLFSLEGVTIGVTPSRRNSNQGFGSAGADVGWYATFRRLQFVGRGTGKVMSDDSRMDLKKISHPAQNVTVSALSEILYSVTR